MNSLHEPINIIMGGDNTNRRLWSEDEINKLLDDYKSQEHEYYNPITGKTLQTRQAWKSSLAVKMNILSFTNFCLSLRNRNIVAFPENVLQ